MHDGPQLSGKMSLMLTKKLEASRHTLRHTYQFKLGAGNPGLGQYQLYCYTHQQHIWNTDFEQFRYR